MSAIDMIVYLSVLIILTGAAVTAIISLNSVFERNKAERILTNAGTAVIERFARDVRDATAVNTLQSTLAASSSVLALTNGATTTTYKVTNGAVVLDVSGVSYGALTPASVQVNNFAVVRYQGATSDLVRLRLDIATNGRYASTTKTFYTAAVLRGSYEK